MRKPVACLVLALAGACSAGPRPAEETALRHPEPVRATAESQPPAQEIPRTVEEQQAIAVAQRHYELALAYYSKGDFERAKVEARRAVQIRHDHLPARKLLGEIYEIIAGPGGLRTAADVELRQRLVGIEQAQIEIVKHLRDGERYYNAKMYRLALKEFESAELKILARPTDVETRNRLLGQARQYKLKAKNALDARR